MKIYLKISPVGEPLISYAVGNTMISKYFNLKNLDKVLNEFSDIDEVIFVKTNEAFINRYEGRIQRILEGKNIKFSRG